MSLYDQIKDDRGYLQLDRVAECVTTLAEDARSGDRTHIEYLARLVAEQADAARNLRLAARLRLARFPLRKTISEFDFEFQPTVNRRLVDDLATLAVEAGCRGYFTNAEETLRVLPSREPALREAALHHRHHQPGPAGLGRDLRDW